MTVTVQEAEPVSNIKLGDVDVNESDAFRIAYAVSQGLSGFAHRQTHGVFRLQPDRFGEWHD
ncbi:MAG: hypothetical protein ACXWLV_12455, partial [Rhizomicrobium sp.]